MPAHRLVLVLVATALLASCEAGPAFTDVQQTDTIEAYEAYVAADPGSIYQSQIDKRLEELYFEKAKAEASLEAWDAYFAKFPEGKHKDDANDLREAALWEKTQEDGTVDAYRKFIEAYPKAEKQRRSKAAGIVAVHDYGKLTVSEPAVKQVNMAEDPKGEMNGWGVYADITNGGDKTLDYVNVTLEYLGDDGKILKRQDWPLTSTTWQTTATKEQQTPMAPGDKRTWEWTVAMDGIPEGWNQKAKVYVSGMRAAGAATAP